MNKTVNINLAGTFFHIDEDAFAKLTRYLQAIKRSFADPQGQDEIIRDIEARISELFSEKIDNESQVITLKELDEVIAVMGQPEDYMIDEEIFDDIPPTQKKRPKSSHKQIFRDIDNKFVGGVASGLGHYIGLDSLWVRLIFIILVLIGYGLPILIYILLWVLVPPAESTSEKLKMSGERINISNIEKKLKKDLENAAEKVKSADYSKVSKGANGFFDTIGTIIIVFLKIIVKFIGIILIIVSLSTLIGLIIGMFSLGTLGIWDIHFMDYANVVNTTGAPLWLVSLLTLFAVGIPFFVLFILGLKLLVNNLKSIGWAAKISLLVIWVFAIIGLGILGLKQATETFSDGTVSKTEMLPIQAGDTLKISMVSNDHYEYNVRRSGWEFIIKDNEAGEKVIYSNNVRLVVRSTNDLEGKVIVEKRAKGFDYTNATNRAEAIEYSLEFKDNTLFLDGYFLTDYGVKYIEQNVRVTVYLPVGTILYADNNTYSFHRNSSYYDDILTNGDEQEYLLVESGRTVCLTCSETRKTSKSRENTTRRSNWNDDDNSNSEWNDEWSDDDGVNTNTNNNSETIETIETVIDSIPVNTVKTDSLQNNI